ncbi:MAG: hypothetical protein WA517_00475 [Candidatus Acidiferrum sp.]
MLREKSALRHVVSFSKFRVKHNFAPMDNRDCATTISMVLGQIRAGKAWRSQITFWLPADESIAAKTDDRDGSLGMQQRYNFLVFAELLSSPA